MLQMLVADGPISGKFGDAMKIYSDIQKASAKAKLPRYYFDLAKADRQFCPALRIEICLWRHPSQRAGIVHPQANAVPLGRQIGAQAPTDPQISMVVDDAAKYVPKHA